MFLLSSSEFKHFRGTWCQTGVRCQHGATSDMRWNKPNRHFAGPVAVASRKDNIFNILMRFGKTSSRKVVWTLARRIFGLTRFSTFLPWRLGLTHAKLEESTSRIASCYGPTWHLKSWLLRCNRSHNLQDLQWPRIQWHVLSGLLRHRRGITSIHVRKGCWLLKLVVW